MLVDPTLDNDYNSKVSVPVNRRRHGIGRGSGGGKGRQGDRRTGPAGGSTEGGQVGEEGKPVGQGRHKFGLFLLLLVERFEALKSKEICSCSHKQDEIVQSKYFLTYFTF